MKTWFKSSSLAWRLLGFPKKFPGAGEAAKGQINWAENNQADKLLGGAAALRKIKLVTLQATAEISEIIENGEIDGGKNKDFALIHGANSVGMLFVLHQWKSIRILKVYEILCFRLAQTGGGMLLS